jgi:hypothetical protein
MRRFIPLLIAGSLFAPSLAHAQTVDDVLAGITELSMASACGFMPSKTASTMAMDLGEVLIYSTPKKVEARRMVLGAINTGFHNAGIAGVCTGYANNPGFQNDINNVMQDAGLPPSFPEQ